MKKFGAILLVVVMLLSMLPINAFAQTPEVTASGSCGDNLSWTLDENGLLVISGTGDMANWNFWDVSAPWLNYSEQISKVIIEEGVTSIGQNAFCSEDSYFDYNDHFYSALTEIVIPNTVTTIHTNGISGLDVLETITLPASATTMVGAAINNNYALKNFVVAEENPVYKDVDGVLFSKDGKTLVSYPIGATAESYTIPQGTETIAAYAFSQCSTTLKEVIFNEELTFIDDEAFQNCDGLTSVELPDSLKQLGGGVFQESSNLSDITLPEGMTRIGGRAFDCTGYYNDWSNWEDNVLYIGPYLLETTYVTPELDWEDWKEKSGTLNVRAGTTLIADESVDSSDVDAVMFNNELQHIGFCAFGWLDIASISLPDSLISLGDWAFYNCELLEEIHIGSNLQYIGHDVFGNTPYDKADNYVDGVLYYGPYVLGFNDSLPNDVVLRDGTTLIAERAFWKEDGRLDSPDYGANMQSVTFPESLTTICDGAFYSCNSLKTLTIPSTVTYIGHQAYGWVKGYDLDIDEETFEKMTDVTIKGYNDTAAHHYATNNDITFVSLDEPVHEHTFKNSSHDNDNHWLECECGEKENATPHSFENDCDAECDCGYTREVTHNYNNKKYNDTHHWNECDCGARSGYAEHKYENVCDADCNECGDVREITYTGVVNLDGEYYFVKNGVPDKTYGWKQVGSKWCFVDATGFAIVNGWVHDSGYWYFLDENGYMASNCWKQDYIGWFYLGSDGTMLFSAWIDDDGKRYYLDDYGYRVIGEYYLGGKYYHFDSDGILQSIIYDGLSYKISEQQALVSGYTGSATEVIIPAQIDGYSVCGIGVSAFADCDNIESVTIGNNIKRISENAFSGCTRLEDIWYLGSETDKNEIDIDNSNDELNTATWHYNVCPKEHTYDNDCDAECNDCGYTRTVTHNYNNLKYNDTHHWNECDCGAIDEENRYGHGYSRYTDKDSHWLECFCGHATEKESHRYDNVLDVDCNECGEIREISDGWHQDNNGIWYYFENGNKVLNDWRQDSKGWVFLGADGAMLTNAWCKDSVGWCYVGADGYAVTNSWKKDSIGWCYLGANGSQVKNDWVYDGGLWYFIDEDGYMVSNQWRQDSKGWVFLGEDGAMLTNAWCTDSQGWCYVGADGYAVTNCWKQDSIGWIWLNGSGSMTKSAWVQDGGNWYYLNANGYMVTGRQLIGGVWYNFNTSGVWVG